MEESSYQLDPRNAAVYFHTILSLVVDDLLERVEGQSDDEKYAQVSTSLREISCLYKQGLSEACSELRSDWSKPANQCAYVYLYFTQHCYMMYMAMQPLLSTRFGHIKARLEHRVEHHGQLRVCSIGGGPGSDVVGLSRFLEDGDLLPASLHFTVLDLFPQWACAWRKIQKHVSSSFSVTYEKCDLVRDTDLSPRVMQRLREADIVTLEKSFSSVAAFMEEEHRRRILLTILCELKLGCLVVFVDNRRRNIVTVPFFDWFALPTGLRLANQWEGMPKIPIRGYSRRVKEFKEIVDYNPMSSCVVTSLLLVKTQPGSIQEVGLARIRHEVYRHSMGDYGGFYEETPLLKNIWFEDRSNIFKDDRTDSDDYTDVDCDSHFEFTEYGYFEKNFRDMRVKKKYPCWIRATKTCRRKMKKNEEKDQRRKCEDKQDEERDKERYASRDTEGLHGRVDETDRT